MRSRRLIPALCTALFLVGGPSAHAQSDGVTVDPGSPTGKEYAIPFEEARREAAGGGDGLGGNSAPAAAPQDRTAPLFGEGIGGDANEPNALARGTEAASRTGGKAGEDLGDERETSERPNGTLQLNSGQPVTAAVPDGGAGSAVTIVAVALSVLLLGTVLGSIVRRRAR